MNEIPNLTFDQKLKAFEIAVKILEKPKFTWKAEDDQSTFQKEMDEYFAIYKGFAKLILREVNSL